VGTWKNWDEWIDHHRAALDGGSHGHELRFAELILKNVVGLSPDSVSHEVPFKDDQGRNRRIDFVINDGKMARPIAIEVDGRDKKGRLLTHEEHDDFVARQNVLTRDFHVLRFTNNQVRKKPEDLRKQIKMAIAKERLKSRRASQSIAPPDLPPVEQVDTQEPPVSAPPRRTRKLLVQPSRPSHGAVAQNRPPSPGDARGGEQASPRTTPERKWRTLFTAPLRRMQKLLFTPPPSDGAETQNPPPLQGDAGADEQATPPIAPERKWKTLSQ